MLGTPYQCFSDRFWYREVHVGHPHRQDVLTPKDGTTLIPLDATRVVSFKPVFEVVVHFPLLCLRYAAITSMCLTGATVPAGNPCKYTSIFLAGCYHEEIRTQRRVVQRRRYVG